MKIITKLFTFLQPFALWMLIVWIIAIIIISSTPHIPSLKIHTSNSEIRLDYLIHFIEYGVLSFLALMTSEKKDFSAGIIRFLIVTAFLVLFSFADEYHQKFIPGRTFNLKDLWSNIAGIMAGAAIYALLRSVVMKEIKSVNPEA
ncbi:MAG TPA: VanZ family protein [Bacteroidales bacterium]|nr:VanZ family protein [Bacteroidales bacterium]